MNSAEDLREYDAPFEDIRAAVNQYLRMIGAKDIQWSHKNQVVKARTPLGFLSLFTTWGENLTIAVDPSGEVWVRSESLNWRNWLDFRTNRLNCRMLLDDVADQLADQKAARTRSSAEPPSNLPSRPGIDRET